jgi:lipopolysaccharide export LptBFGC system permease protein LptF
MNRLSRNLSAILITGVLAMPMAVTFQAATTPQSEQQAHEDKERAEKQEKAAKADKKLRVYDAKHSDYHNWDANEDRAYRRYLSEKHENYEDYGKLSKDKQTDYWEWRHTHTDSSDADHDRDRDDKH